MNRFRAHGILVGLAVALGGCMGQSDIISSGNDAGTGADADDMLDVPSTDDADSMDSGEGGSSGNGGASSETGGSSGTGGMSSSTGGASATGGSSTGGSTATGGSSATGGRSGSGGATNTGGSSSSTGGTLGSGGMVATGGSSSTGGASATGGAVSTGGATGTGGSTSTGGATSSGGANATGGAPGTGGSTSPKTCLFPLEHMLPEGVAEQRGVLFHGMFGSGWYHICDSEYPGQTMQQGLNYICSPTAQDGAVLTFNIMGDYVGPSTPIEGITGNLSNAVWEDQNPAHGCGINVSGCLKLFGVTKAGGRVLTLADVVDNNGTNGGGNFRVTVHCQ